MTTPDPWLGSVSLRSNICTRHLSSETDKRGKCLGCAVEKEREILVPEWKFVIKKVVDPEPGAKPELINSMSRRDRNFYRFRPITELAAHCVINDCKTGGHYRRYTKSHE